MENGLARIKTIACTGCGLCVKACPTKLISIEDTGIAVYVLCRSLEKGAIVRKKCSKGCLGCGKCARECLSKAITVENSLAQIDYEKCSHCGGCAEVCLTKCLQRTGH
jgi:ferredoxin